MYRISDENANSGKKKGALRRLFPFDETLRPQKELRRTIANAITKIATVSTIPRTIS